MQVSGIEEKFPIRKLFSRILEKKFPTWKKNFQIGKNFFQHGNLFPNMRSFFSKQEEKFPHMKFFPLWRLARSVVLARSVCRLLAHLAPRFTIQCRDVSRQEQKHRTWCGPHRLSPSVRQAGRAAQKPRSEGREAEAAAHAGCGHDLPDTAHPPAAAPRPGSS